MSNKTQKTTIKLFSPDLEVVEFPDGSFSVFDVGVADEEVSAVQARKVHHQTEFVDLTHSLENLQK